MFYLLYYVQSREIPKNRFLDLLANRVSIHAFLQSPVLSSPGRSPGRAIVLSPASALALASAAALAKFNVFTLKFFT